MYRGCNSPHRGRISQHSTCEVCIEAVTAHMDSATVNAEATTACTAHAKGYMQAETSHMATATACTVPGAIEPPFEPAATVREKMVKLFLTALVTIRGSQSTHFKLFYLREQTRKSEKTA